MDHKPTLTRRLALLGATGALVGTLLAPAAFAAPAADVLQRAREAVVLGQAAAQDLAEPAGDEEKLTGLARAEQATTAAAERKAARTGQEFPGNGRALGRGHAAVVHAILGDGSPSDLPPHGETVSGLAKAFETLKADHPGRGLGLTKERPPRGSDDEAEPGDEG